MMPWSGLGGVWNAGMCTQKKDLSQFSHLTVLPIHTWRFFVPQSEMIQTLWKMVFTNRTSSVLCIHGHCLAISRAEGSRSAVYCCNCIHWNMQQRFTVSKEQRRMMTKYWKSSRCTWKKTKWITLKKILKYFMEPMRVWTAIFVAFYGQQWWVWIGRNIIC